MTIDGTFTSVGQPWAMNHFVYIAASSRLLDWSSEKSGRPAVKVGESWNPADREVYLCGRDPHERGRVRACGGFDDWKIVKTKSVPSRNAGLELEAMFKTAFDSAELEPTGAGESDIVLLPEKALVGEALAKLHPDVRELYLAARARLYDAVRAAPVRPGAGHHDEFEIDRERDRFERDAARSRAEDLDRADRARDDGLYHDD